MHQDREKTAQQLAEALRGDLGALARRGSATSADVMFAAPSFLAAIADREGDAEDLIDELRRAVSELPPKDRIAIEIILGLDEESRGQKFGIRRERAGRALSVKADTFRTHYESRLLDSVAQNLAVRLLSEVKTAPDSGSNHSLKSSARRRVLLIHSAESAAAPEIREFLHNSGLEPMNWDEALEFIGLSSPAVLDRFQSCLEVVQAVVVLLEDQSRKARENLLFEAGMAVGSAAERTIVVEVGGRNIPGSMSAMRILNLRNSAESRDALLSELRRAGCAVAEAGEESEGSTDEDLAAGWYRWTPTISGRLAFSEIAVAVQEFESDGSYGAAAEEWLRNDSLAAYPSVVTYLLVRHGRVEGFFALESGSVLLTSDESTAVSPRPEKPSAKIFGASTIKWLARHKDADDQAEESLVLRALSVALEISEKQGSIALLVDPFDPVDAERWVSRHLFQRARDGRMLWFPLGLPAGESSVAAA